MFNQMLDGVKEEAVGFLFNFQVQYQEEEAAVTGVGEAPVSVRKASITPRAQRAQQQLLYSAPAIDGEADGGAVALQDAPALGIGGNGRANGGGNAGNGNGNGGGNGNGARRRGTTQNRPGTRTVAKTTSPAASGSASGATRAVGSGAVGARAAGSVAGGPTTASAAGRTAAGAATAASTAAKSAAGAAKTATSARAAAGEAGLTATGDGAKKPSLGSASGLGRAGGSSPGAQAVNKLPAPGQVVGGGGPSRNGPCPCGSGKKYKRCHGAPNA